MKKSLFAILFIVILFASPAIAASTGVIDPNNAGNYKAAFLDNSVVANTAINFGKFTTEAQYDISVTNTALSGYAWGSSVGWIVTNCSNTTSGCSSTNGNFAVANDGTGLLSGYAWGENTGWINFGPFTTTGISTVKIDNTTGNFEGTQGSAGYAWSQNYGWIVFDCTNAATCVNTDWRPTVTPPPVTTPPSSGGGILSGGSMLPQTPATPPPVVTPPTNPVTPTPPTSPSSPSSPTSPYTPPAGGTTTTTNPGGGSGDQINPIQPTNPPTNTAPGNAPTNSTQPTSPIGLQLPPTMVESANDIWATFVNTASGVIGAARTTAGRTTSGFASAFGIIFTALAGLALLWLANPLSLAELFLLPFRLWSLLLIAFGFKKRNRPWGTVYDSVTKQPIDPAYVMLVDMAGNEVATSITDIDGRYGFAVAAGTYKIIANKTNYEFPSRKLAGRTGDELYNNLYFGETIVVDNDNDVITKNIPLDQLNFDWNEFAKNEQKRLSYYRRSDVTIARLSNFFFWLGFIVSAIALLSAHTTYNIIIFILYVVMFLVRHYSPQFQPKGSISEAMTGDPSPFAILRIISAATGQEIAHKVADRLGNYYCLVPNGTYNITVDRKNPDGGYTKVAVPQIVVVKKGYLKQNFEI